MSFGSLFSGAAAQSLGQAAGSLATGVAGGLIGAFTHKRQAARNYKYQKRLNEQQHNYNQQLAQMQNQMNVEQWERENAYNTPKQQMQRLIAAGLNPDLVAQGLGGISAQSPMLTSGAPYPSTDYAALSNAASQSTGTILGAATDMAQTVSNVQSQDGQSTYFQQVRDIRRQLEQGTLVMQGVQIDLANFDLKEMKPAERRKVIHECTALQQQAAVYQQQIKESRAKVGLLNAQEQGQILDNMFAEDSYDDRLGMIGMQFAKSVFDAKISQEQAKYYGAYMLAQIWNLNTQSALNQTKKAIADIEKEIAEKTKDKRFKLVDGQLQFDSDFFALNSEYSEVLWWLGQIRDFLGDITDGANLWKMFLGKPKKNDKPKHRTSRTEKSDGTWTQTDTYDN